MPRCVGTPRKKLPRWETIDIVPMTSVRKQGSLASRDWAVSANKNKPTKAVKPHDRKRVVFSDTNLGTNVGISKPFYVPEVGRLAGTPKKRHGRVMQITGPAVH